MEFVGYSGNEWVGRRYGASDGEWQGLIKSNAGIRFNALDGRRYLHVRNSFFQSATQARIYLALSRPLSTHPMHRIQW